METLKKDKYGQELGVEIHSDKIKQLSIERNRIQEQLGEFADV
ncbi:MAG: hypothetical protein WBP08_12270 [Saprospiraceae bacterium]